MGEGYNRERFSIPMVNFRCYYCTGDVLWQYSGSFKILNINPKLYNRNCPIAKRIQPRTWRTPRGAPQEAAMSDRASEGEVQPERQWRKAHAQTLMYLILSPEPSGGARVLFLTCYPGTGHGWRLGFNYGSMGGRKP